MTIEEAIELAMSSSLSNDAYDTLAAELRRLQGENYDIRQENGKILHSCLIATQRAEKAEAKLSAALKVVEAAKNISTWGQGPAGGDLHKALREFDEATK